MTAQVPAGPRCPDVQCVRVGVALRSLSVPAWQHLALAKISQCDRVRLAAVVLLEPEVERSPAACAVLLERMFEWHETRKCLARRAACEIESAADLLEGVPTHRLPAAETPGGATQRREVLDGIVRQALDVIVLLSHVECIEELCAASRFGVWYYQHDVAAPGDAAGRSVGLWEVMTRKPCVKSTLKAALPSEAQDRTLQHSYSAIDHHSFTRTRNEHLWKGASFLARKLCELAESGWDALRHTEPSPEAPTGPPRESTGSLPPKSIIESAAESITGSLCGSPAASIGASGTCSRPATRGSVGRPVGPLSWIAPFLGYVLWRAYMKVAMRAYLERWILLFDFGERTTDFSGYRKLIPPPDRFWADPHIVHKDGGYYVFIEEAPLATRRGHISVLRRHEDGSFGAPVPVITRPYHLSYPFIFEWHGELFIVPESSEHRTIEVYRCKRFPEEWVLECVLMEGVAAVDTTLVQHDGRWWLFTNIKENEGAAWDELFLFCADNPLSTRWQAHARNPVVSDVRCSRLAGALYHEGGHLYRPSQDGSYRYGYGLRLNRVLELTRTAYREELVSHFKPGWDRSIRAIHSYSHHGSLTVIDGIYRHRRPRAASTPALVGRTPHSM